MAERIRNNTEFCTLAFPDPINKRVYKVSQHHNEWDRRQEVHNTGATNEAYNREFMGAKDVEALPRYDNVLVLGAGPSLTQDAIIDHLPGKDAVLITLPLIRALEPMLDMPGIYTVDAEREMFIVPHFHGPHTARERCICTSVKHLENCRPFRELYLYDRAKRSWPWTSGAVALAVALDCMRAKRVDVLGIDLTGHYVKFRDETEPLLKRCRELSQ